MQLQRGPVYLRYHVRARQMWRDALRALPAELAPRGKKGGERESACAVGPIVPTK
jgi:hypothetical protein